MHVLLLKFTLIQNLLNRFFPLSTLILINSKEFGIQTSNAGTSPVGFIKHFCNDNRLSTWKLPQNCQIAIAMIISFTLVHYTENTDFCMYFNFFNFYNSVLILF